MEKEKEKEGTFGDFGKNFSETFFANSMPSPIHTMSASFVGRFKILSLTKPPIIYAGIFNVDAASLIF